MSSCKRCNKKNWSCLGCNNMISVELWKSLFNERVAVYCDCCNHQYVCKTCYNKNPGFDAWSPRFGQDHSVTDLISGESHMSRMMAQLMKGNVAPNQVINGTPFYFAANPNIKK